LNGNVTTEAPGQVERPFSTNSNVHGETVSKRFDSDQAAPGFVTLVDDLHGVFFVFGLAGEGKGVLRFAVGDLVDPRNPKLKMVFKI